MFIFGLHDLLRAIEDDNSASTAADMALLDDGEVTSPVVPAKGTPREDQPPEDEPEGDQPVVDENEEEVLGETEEAPEGTDTDEILPHQRPTVSALREKYPELFKEFPTLKASIFREKAYSEVFPTVNDAKQASENNETFLNMRNDILIGGGEQLVTALKDDGSLNKFADKFLTNLFKADKDVHWRTISPILEDAARAFYQQGITSKNDNVKHAAEHLALFLFGDVGFANGQKTVRTSPTTSKEKIGDEETDTAKERREFETQRYNDFNGEVKQDAYTNLKSVVTLGLPKEGLTKWQRDKLTEDIIVKVDQAIASDKAHMKFVQGLWKKAREARFDTGSKTRITNAYLARAKTLVPGIRRAMITEALGEVSPRAEEVTEQVTSRRAPTAAGRPGSSNGKVNSKQIDWRRTSDADFLNDNITLKKQ